jgi:hypothetical protein
LFHRLKRLKPWGRIAFRKYAFLYLKSCSNQYVVLWGLTPKSFGS